LVSTVS